MTGDRGSLAPRLAGAVATKLIMAMRDPADVAILGIAPSAIPQRLVPGRAVLASDATQVQLAHLGEDPARQAQVRALARIASHYQDATTGEASSPPISIAGEKDDPVRIRELPRHVALAALPAAPGRIRLGIGGDAAEPVTIDLFAGASRLIVTGPARSGRSSVLHTVLVESHGTVPVIVAAPERSPLAASARDLGCAVVGPGNDLADLPSPSPSTLLIVDDAESFSDTAIGEALTSWLHSGRPGLAAVAAVRRDELALTFRGVAAEIRRTRCGLLLSPAPADSELIGHRLPRYARQLAPGRGLLCGDPAWGAQFGAAPVPIQVALP
jgi:S-DNA-T family DNA segregation ATPase FtsK/SpoIIIE